MNLTIEKLIEILERQGVITFNILKEELKKELTIKTSSEFAITIYINKQKRFVGVRYDKISIESLATLLEITENDYTFHAVSGCELIDDVFHLTPNAEITIDSIT